MCYIHGVDDIFVICSSCMEAKGLLWQLNLLGCLPWRVCLGVLVERYGSFVPSLYRKPIFTGPYISWDSFSPEIVKKHLIKTLVHRALLIYSSTKLDFKLRSITEILLANGYSLHIIEKFIGDKTLAFKGGIFWGSRKRPVYVKLPRLVLQARSFHTRCYFAINVRTVFGARKAFLSFRTDGFLTIQYNMIVFSSFF